MGFASEPGLKLKQNKELTCMLRAKSRGSSLSHRERCFVKAEVPIWLSLKVGDDKAAFLLV